MFCVFEVVLQTISDVYIYYWTRCYEYSLKTARWMLNNVQSILGWKYKLESIWHTSNTSTYRQIMWHWMCLHRGVEGSPPPPRNHKRTHTLLWQKFRRSWVLAWTPKNINKLRGKKVYWIPKWLFLLVSFKSLKPHPHPLSATTNICSSHFPSV